MKRTSLMTRLFTVFGLALLGLIVARPASAQDLSIFCSPSAFFETQAMQEVKQLEAWDRLTEKVFTKIDEEYEKAASAPGFPRNEMEEAVAEILEIIEEESEKEIDSSKDVFEIILDSCEFFHMEMEFDPETFGRDEPTVTELRISEVLNYDPEILGDMLEFADDDDYRIIETDGRDILVIKAKMKGYDERQELYCATTPIAGTDKFGVVAALDREHMQERVEQFQDEAWVEEAMAKDWPIWAIQVHQSFIEKLQNDDDEGMRKLSSKTAELIESIVLKMEDDYYSSSLSLTIELTDPSVARKVKEILEGGIAFMSLIKHDEEIPREGRILMNILSGLVVKTDNGSVGVVLTLDDPIMLELVDKVLTKAAAEVD